MKNSGKVRFWVMVLWLGVMLMTLLPGVGGAIPQKINYQGYLTNAAGVPINGTLQMVFSLYNSPSAPTPLWTEQQSVPVINGIYNVSLGETLAIPLPFDVPYYLGIQVGADPEMTPRKALTSVGYAFRAMTADVVGAHTHSGTDITSGTVAEPRIDSAIARTSALNAHTSNTNNPHSTTAAQVGAVPLNAANSVTSLMISDGTISPVDLGFSYAGSATKGGPAADLNCTGCVSSGELADAAVSKGKLSATGGTSGQVLGTDGAILAWQPGSGWTDEGTWVKLATGTDKVGIGTNNIQAKLEVGDLMRVQGPGWPTWPASGQGMELGYSSDLNRGYIQVYNRSAGQGVNPWGDLYLGDGNVGIGVTPEVKLDVNGWVKARNGYGDAISIGGDNVGDDLEINIYPTVDWVNTVSFWNGRTAVAANIKVNEVQFSDGTRVASYRGFPRPNFDSGWYAMLPGSSATFSHDLGGDVNKYFVDLQYKATSFYLGIHNWGFGYFFDSGSAFGAYYDQLTANTITVTRGSDDWLVEQVRVRIWKYE